MAADIRYYEAIARKLVDIGAELDPEHQAAWDEIDRGEQNFAIEVIRKAVDDKIIEPGVWLFPKP